MNPIEPILFIMVLGCAIALLTYSIPQMKEAVSWWIGFKYEEIKSKKHISPLKSKKDRQRDKFYNETVRKAQLEHIRQIVTKYWLMVLGGLTIFFVSIFWLINYSTTWKILLQYLLA